MTNPVTDFMDKAKGLTRNPLGIIALFVSLIYGFACLVLSTSISNLHGQEERLPLIWFIILFPLLILGAFTYLVIYHHKKLYAPSDYKDEKNFVNAFIGNKDVSSDLEKVNIQLKSLKSEKDDKNLIASINNISNEIERIKEKSEKIPINNLWRLNHWGSNCASIVGNKMIFEGTSAPKAKDGSHIDLNNILEIGMTYEISCFAKSNVNTTGMFQLWCHDKTGVKPDGSHSATPYKTPKTEGELIKLNFKAEYNKNIRIHLQYTPGQGQIEVSEIKISKLRS
ncbi:MAG: hypothetical protein ACOCWG_03695 [bacterium]